jgi:hypothetical protein
MLRVAAAITQEKSNSIAVEAAGQINTTTAATYALNVARDVNNLSMLHD